uniref:Uncharacterized protein n=1 Tax=Anguilla anguilla TaxID=7936 RepID=A0A0E9RYE2_ANGAN
MYLYEKMHTTWWLLIIFYACDLNRQKTPFLHSDWKVDEVEPYITPFTETPNSVIQEKIILHAQY